MNLKNLILICCLSVLTRASTPIILDTDIMSDVDDVGAIAIANILHNCGLADLRGIAINTHSRYGALAANVGFFVSIPQNPILMMIERLCAPTSTIVTFR